MTTLEDLINKEPILASRWKSAKESAKTWLRALVTNGFSHSEEIEGYLNQLLPENVKTKIQPPEAFVLLYAVYLHDIGKAPGSREHVAVGTSHEHASYLEITKRGEKYGLKNMYEAEAVALVARAHASEKENPIGGMDREYGVQSLSRVCKLDLQFLGALLRFADEIDNAFMRVAEVPSEVTSTRTLIRFVDIDKERWVVKFQHIASTDDERKRIVSMIDHIQRRLDEIREVFVRHELFFWKIEEDPTIPERNILRGPIGAETSSKIEDLLKSNFGMIREVLENEQIRAFRNSFLEIMLKSVLIKVAPVESVALKKSIAEIGRSLVCDTLSRDPVRNAEALYSAIIEIYLKEMRIEEAKEWASEAITFFINEDKPNSALLFVEEMIDDVLFPNSRPEAILEVCKRGLEIAKVRKDFSAEGDLSLQVGSLHESIDKDKKLSEQFYREAAESYVKSCDLSKEDSWKSTRDLRLAFLTSRTHLADDMVLSENIEHAKAKITPRSAGRVIAIVGVRAAGVFAHAPSIVFSSITQSPNANVALLIDLGMEHELVSHLSSFAFHHLPPQMSLIGILERGRRKEKPSIEEIADLRYDNLLKNGLFQVRGDSHDSYVREVEKLAERGKVVYVLPLATNHVAPQEILKFTNEEVFTTIKEMCDALRPDFLFIARPGLPKEGRFIDLDPPYLLHFILDLADNIIVMARGDGQANLDLYLHLAKTICRKASWGLKTNVCVNRLTKGLKMPVEIQNRICLQVPWVPEWGEIVENDRIPFVELDLQGGAQGHESLSAKMKKMWDFVLRDEKSHGEDDI